MTAGADDVERVAVALYQHWRHPMQIGWKWSDDLPAHVTEYWRQGARLAIEAMGTPAVRDGIETRYERRGKEVWDLLTGTCVVEYGVATPAISEWVSAMNLAHRRSFQTGGNPG